MNKNTKKIAGVGLLTAIVVVLQLLGSFIHFGPFSISLVLIPIVVGAALYGELSGVWLGLAFGVTVLVSGDAAAFITVNPAGTDVLVYMVTGLVGLNFIFELGANLILSPTIVKLVSLGRKENK